MRSVKVLVAALLLAGPGFAEDLPRAASVRADVGAVASIRGLSGVTWAEDAHRWQALEVSSRPVAVESEWSPVEFSARGLEAEMRAFEGLGVTAVFRGAEEAPGFVPIAGNPLALGLLGLGVDPLGARADVQEVSVRPFLPQRSARVLPEPWDLVPYSLWTGSPAGRLRQAANRAEGEQVTQLRAEFWETVNAALRRRELFDRLERDALDRGRGRD